MQDNLPTVLTKLVHMVKLLMDAEGEESGSGSGEGDEDDDEGGGEEEDEDADDAGDGDAADEEEVAYLKSIKDKLKKMQRHALAEAPDDDDDDDGADSDGLYDNAEEYSSPIDEVSELGALFGAVQKASAGNPRFAAAQASLAPDAQQALAELMQKAHEWMPRA